MCLTSTAVHPIQARIYQEQYKRRDAAKVTELNTTTTKKRARNGSD